MKVLVVQLDHGFVCCGGACERGFEGIKGIGGKRKVLVCLKVEGLKKVLRCLVMSVLPGYTRYECPAYEYVQVGRESSGVEPVGKGIRRDSRALLVWSR
jgi:hypothetical protein